jgi:hypothetical protein
MSFNMSIYEMLESVDKEKNKAVKISLLQQYSKESQALKIVMELAFDKAWQWLLPEGDPPFNPSPKEADLQHVLKADARRLQYFVNTPQGNAIKPLRRETMFIELLEAVDPLDAKLLLSAKSKKLPFKSVTKKLVTEAFPEETEGWL